ncbi:putative RNA-binding Zn-ribbon protein involved in translation (DUF1610 family) [Bacillus benzoevorans]|uniref:Putative RNA-binding Zn-ribbon protein involved in translation (DUF1610 family) n=2 Tax=Bacillus benzoevorans TaxID=1456 RepID=A0A7X0HPH7_9BACI|nr:putative RNA-binding Zn-ribbon protein involved in translation (DUF1610 family) [Bacillus benzoevorans]
MKVGLWKTAASIYEPFMDGDIEKVHRVSDQLFGVKWYFLTNEISETGRIVQKRINGRPYIIVHQERQLKVFSGICASCSQLLFISAANAACKCFTCGEEVILSNHDSFNSKIILECPVKREKDGYYIGLKKNTQDGQYA